MLVYIRKLQCHIVNQALWRLYPLESFLPSPPPPPPSSFRFPPPPPPSLPFPLTLPAHPSRSPFPPPSPFPLPPASPFPPPSMQDGSQGRVNQETRLDNRIIDLRVSPTVHNFYAIKGERKISKFVSKLLANGAHYIIVRITVYAF